LRIDQNELRSGILRERQGHKQLVIRREVDACVYVLHLSNVFRFPARGRYSHDALVRTDVGEPFSIVRAHRESIRLPVRELFKIAAVRVNLPHVCAVARRTEQRHECEAGATLATRNFKRGMVVIGEKGLLFTRIRRYQV